MLILNTTTAECYEKASFTTFPLYFAPLHEYILNPFLHRYFYWMHSYRKFSIGVALQLARVMILMAYLITARYTYISTTFMGKMLLQFDVFFKKTTVLYTAVSTSG